MVELDVSEDGPGQHPVLFLKGLWRDGRCAAFPAKGSDLAQNWVKVENLDLTSLLPAVPPLGGICRFALLGSHWGRHSHWWIKESLY